MERKSDEFLQRLKQIVGENQTEFAERLGISQSLLNKYVRGEVLPGYHFFSLLIDRTDADLNWLFGGTERKSHTKKDKFDYLLEDINMFVRRLPNSNRHLIQKLLLSLRDSIQKKKSVKSSKGLSVIRQQKSYKHHFE